MQLMVPDQGILTGVFAKQVEIICRITRRVNMDLLVTIIRL
jgi:hypothetical protein